MIKNILFDMGGVIFTQNNDEAFRRFRSIGVDTDYYMGAYGQKDYFLDLETGSVDDDEFCRRLSATVGRDVSWSEAQHCWLGFFDGVELQRLNNLVELRNRHRLCLLSNTNPFVMDFTRSRKFSQIGKPITDFFDSLFLSYEMKVCKPDKDIFLRALAADGMKADECLFVDDSAKNTDAAKAVGMHVLTVKTNEDWMPGVMCILAEVNGE